MGAEPAESGFASSACQDAAEAADGSTSPTIGANARRATEDSTSVAYIGEPTRPRRPLLRRRSSKQRRTISRWISRASSGQAREAVDDELLEARSARRRRHPAALRELASAERPARSRPRASPRSASSRSGMPELVAEVQRPPRHRPAGRPRSTLPNSLPNLRSSDEAGDGNRRRGGPSARPSAFENSRLVTGLGAVALTTPLTFSFVERPEQDPDLVVDVDPGACTGRRRRSARRRRA